MIDVQTFATFPAKSGFMLLAYRQGIAIGMVSAPHYWSPMQGRLTPGPDKRDNF